LRKGNTENAEIRGERKFGMEDKRTQKKEKMESRTSEQGGGMMMNMIMMAMMDGPNWMVSVPVTSFQLLVAGGALLVFAAVLLGLRRRTRVMVERSLLTDELMIYLGRIADALEHPRTSSTDDVTVAVMRRMEEMGNAKANGKVREMPFTMLGREVRTED